jgi:hypothetical protein
MSGCVKDSQKSKAAEPWLFGGCLSGVRSLLKIG